MLGSPPAFLSLDFRILSALAWRNFSGQGRPNTFGAVSKISCMHPARCRCSSGSRDMRALPVRPARTEDGFIEALICARVEHEPCGGK